MITRQEVISQACEQCMKELYSYAKPNITWDSFVEENKEYNKNHKLYINYQKAFDNKEKDSGLWEQYKLTYPSWENKSMVECIGPAPFEFYYLPEEVLKNICDSYIYSYKLDEHQELLNIINILKEYCKNPTIDTYVEPTEDRFGYRTYEHPDNLEKQLTDLIPDSGFDKSAIAETIKNKFFEFLDMAGEFYSWNKDLISFNMSVYLGASPNSNKEAVIKNWKEYRNKDIEINEEQIKNNYYGDDE